MNLDDLSQHRIDELCILGVIRDVGAKASATTTQIVDRASEEFGWSADAILGLLRGLADSGMVALDERLSNVIAGARLLPAGSGSLRDFEEERSSLVKRRRRLRDEYLGWLYTQIEENDLSPTPDAFLATGPRFYGLPYTSKDLEKAGEWLKNNGFIDGEAAWQYDGPLRPTLRQKGVYTVENGRSVSDPAPVRDAGATITVVHGPANVNNGGNNVTQNLSIEWASAGGHLLDSIEQALPALSAELAGIVRVHIDDARAELAGAGDVSKLRKTLEVLAGFLGATTAGALGNLLSGQVAEFLATLPG